MKSVEVISIKECGKLSCQLQRCCDQTVVEVLGNW